LGVENKAGKFIIDKEGLLKKAIRAMVVPSNNCLCYPNRFSSPIYALQHAPKKS
jgi:hypothetical protein